MAILTKPTISKGQANEFDLSKSDLAAVSKVVNDSYFSDQTNWSKVIVEYKSAEGNQHEMVIFDASEASPKGNFEVSEKAKDSWEVQSVKIMDFDGGYLKLNRGDLTVEDFDIVLGSVGGGVAGWSTSYYASTAITLSNSNFTATIDNNSGQGAIMYADNQIDYNGSEKVYKEITVNHKQRNLTYATVGIRVFDTVPSDFNLSNNSKFDDLSDEVAELYWETHSSSIKYSINNETSRFAGGGFPTISTNDVLMIAIDTSVNKIWFGKNGNWFSSGGAAANPATNTGGIDYAAAFAGASNLNNIFIGLMDLDFGNPDPQFTINETPSHTPSGFTEI